MHDKSNYFTYLCGYIHAYNLSVYIHVYKSRVTGHNFDILMDVQSHAACYNLEISSRYRPLKACYFTTPVQS